MAYIKTKFLQDDSVTGAKVKLANNENLRARNFANNADVNILKVNASNEIELASTPKVGANTVLTSDQKGAANGLCPLDGDSKVAAIYLPSYVDDVLEYADFAALPVTGETSKIYVTLDNGKCFRWSGSAYVEVSPNAVNSVAGKTGIVTLDKNDVGLSNVTNVEQMPISYLDTDGTLAANSDTKVASQKAVKTYVASAIGAASVNTKETFTLDATDISNGYIDLSNTPIAGSINLTVAGAGNCLETVDYTVASARITFIGDLASILEVGDKVQVQYER